MQDNLNKNKNKNSFLDDPDMPDEEEEIEKPLLPRPLRIIWNIIRYLFWAGCAAVIGILVWRAFFSTNISGGVDTVYPDEKLCAAYKTWLADTSADKAPFGIYQKYWLKRCMTTEEADEEEGTTGNYGYFGIPDTAIFPSAGEIQFVFRYNKSTLEHLAEDYGLSDVPGSGGDYYVIKLRVVTDNTPDNEEDSDTVERTYDCITVGRDSTAIYCYRQMRVGDIEDSEHITAVYADIYYKEDMDAPEPYGTITLYTSDKADSPYKLDRKDKAALGG